MISKGLPEDPAARPERIYAIGDVHGHSDRLRALHQAVTQDLAKKPCRTALLIHLGDYVDRGPDSAGCVALLAAAEPVRGVPTINLMGNHERMMLDALSDPEAADLWLQNGGDASLASWDIPLDLPHPEWRARLPPEHLRFLQSLALFHVAGGYAFVHAGVQPGLRLDWQNERDLLWIRGGFLEWQGVMLPEAPERIVVHGHTPVRAPEIRHNRIGIDTNAGRGGRLTCAVLARDSVYFLQV